MSPRNREQQLHDQVRVDGVILDMIERNDGNFINNLRRQAARINPDNRSEGFQVLLDGMRQVLLEDLHRNPRAFPNLSDNGRPESGDHILQRDQLRAIKQDIGTENGTPARLYRPQSHYQNIACVTPDIDQPYSRNGNMVLSIASHVADGCHRQDPDTLVCPLPPIRDFSGRGPAR